MAQRAHRNGRRSPEVAQLNAAFTARARPRPNDAAPTAGPVAGTGPTEVCASDLVPLQPRLDTTSAVEGSARSRGASPPANALAQSLSSGAVATGSAHPLARRLYAFLRDGSVVDKRLVFETVVQRLGVQCTTAKQEKAYQSIAVFVERFGYVPAAQEWENWRKSPEAPKGLRSMTFVRNAFGGWPQVRQAFYEVAPTPDALAHHELLARGEAYGEAELVNLVRVWSETVEGPLYQHALVAWCRSDAPVSLGVARTPADWSAFGRLFVWEDLLDAAGSARRRGTRRRPSGPERVIDDRPAATRIAQPGGEQSSNSADQGSTGNDELLELFMRFAAGYEGVLMYDHFLAFLAKQRDEPGTPARGWAPYRRAFGRWEGLLRAADCWQRSQTAMVAASRASEPKPPPNAPRVYSSTPTAVLLRTLRYAASRFGPTISKPQYENWRARMLLCAQRHGRPMPTIPSSATMIKRCGSWPAAKLEAGLLTAQELADQPDRRSHRPEVLTESAWLAMCAHGSSVSDTQYVLWRRGRLQQLRLDGVPVARVPRAELLRTHLGGEHCDWSVVLDTVWELLTSQQRAVVPQLGVVGTPGAGTGLRLVPTPGTKETR